MVRGHTPSEVYALIESELKPHFEALVACGSTPELRAHPVYRSIESTVLAVLATTDLGSFASVEAPPKGRYRRIDD